MADPLTSASAIADGLSSKGLAYVAALALVAVALEAVYIARIQGLRISDLRAYALEIKALQDQRVGLAESIIPVAKDLAMGAVGLRAIAKDLLEATPPGRRRRTDPELAAVPSATKADVT